VEGKSQRMSEPLHSRRKMQARESARRKKSSLSGKAIGRPAIPPVTRTAIRLAYMAGDVGLRSVAQQFGVGIEAVRRCVSEPGRPFEHGAVGAPQ
jgi:hypothetical protein